MSDAYHSSRDARAIWSLQSSNGYADGEITVSAHANGVLIEVEQDKAVGSYNDSFNCSSFLNWKEWEALISKINEAKP